MPSRNDYFDDQKLRAGLAGKAVRGAAYVGIGQAVSIGVNLLAIPLLARLLEEEDFGLVAMAAVLSTTANVLINTGLGVATLQKKNLTPEQTSNLFWINAGLGALIASVLVAVSPLVSWTYGEPRVAPILTMGALAFVLGGMTAQHQSLLQRSMRFDLLTSVNVGSAVFGQSLAVGLAYLWRNEPGAYWALVFGPLAGQTLRLVGVWLASGWRPSLPKRGVGTRELLGFGANLTAFQLLNHFAREADNFLIGWWWGPYHLGFYVLAYRLFLTPLRAINGPATGVVLPTLSRLNDEPQRYRDYYLAVTTALTLITVPLCVTIGANADVVVALAFGDGWDEVAPILKALCFVGVVQCLSNTFGWLYASQNRSNQALRAASVVAPLHILSFVIGLPWGAHGVAISYAAIGALISFPLSLYWVGSAGPVGRSHLTKLLGVVVTVALAVLVGSVLAEQAVEGWSPASRVAVAVASSVASTACAFLVLARLGMVPSLTSALKRIRRTGPAPAGA